MPPSRLANTKNVVFAGWHHYSWRTVEPWYCFLVELVFMITYWLLISACMNVGVLCVFVCPFLSLSLSVSFYLCFCVFTVHPVYQLCVELACTGWGEKCSRSATANEGWSGPALWWASVSGF